MNTSRTIKSYWTLTWSISIVSLVFGLIGWGIYLGDIHRQAVLGFERDYLGFKGETAELQPIMGNTIPLAPDQTRPNALPPKMELPATASLPVQDWKPEQPIQQNPVPYIKEIPTPMEPIAAPRPAVVARDPIGSLMVPIAIRAKVVVDDRLVSTHPDWIAQVQRTVSAASQIYRVNFGIDLLLVGIVRWPETLEGLDIETIYAKLRRCPREGADVVLGFVTDRLGAYGYSKGDPSIDSPLNNAYGLVGAIPGSEPSHLLGVLRSVSHLLGAREVVDPNSESYRMGSWMSDAPIITGRTPWIDLENRQRILERKSRPFVAEGRYDRQ